MILFWLGVAVLLSMPTLVVLLTAFALRRVFVYYMPKIVRIFQERPLFIVPRGQPLPEAEEVRFPTADGLTLHGCYLRSPVPRRGVILFGLEYGSSCWSCWAYCERLVANGFDVFAFESRNQGQSDAIAGYDPLQWVTDYEIIDTEAAVAYLEGRPDADPRGIGLFGISKGAGAGVTVAGRHPSIRCCVTDGMFATYTTLAAYMKQWFTIYNAQFPPVLIPRWVLWLAGTYALRVVQRERGCHFPPLEPALRRLSPRPLLMIHGDQDTYIKTDIARALFDQAGAPKEFWLVANAKHNQALHIAGDEYHERVLRFFDRHLAGQERPIPFGRPDAAAVPPPLEGVSSGKG